MYQQLRGAAGREVYFRAPRRRAEWLSGSDTPAVRFGNHRATLCNLSLSGMLVQTPPGVSVGDGLIAPVELSVLGEVVYRGTGLAVRSEKRPRGDRIGVKLLRAVDPEELRRRARTSRFRVSLGAGLSVYASAPREYRSAVSEAALVLQHWRTLTDNREDEIREEGGPALQERIDDLEDLAESRVRVDWNSVRQKAILASNDLDPNDLEGTRAAKRVTELTLTPILCGGLIWEHAYQKPRGYPGDFELMNFMYETRRRGSSVFSRILHQIGLEERLAATVRDRRDYLTGEILADAARRTSDDEFRVANLGSGPAQELGTVLNKWDRDQRLVLTLIDQDEGALEFADRVLRMSGTPLGGRLEVRCRHIAFGDLVRDRNLLTEIAGQDLLYSAGLFDYLPDRVASDLLARLFSLLRPGGRILVGNALDADDVKWVPEFVLDWHMIYRKPAEMTDLCHYVASTPPPRVVRDASGAWQFLELRQPA